MRLLLPAALLLLSACSLTVPLTRKEFIDAVNAGKGPTKAESYTVGRSFGEVYGTLARNVPKCLDKTVKRSGMVGGQMHVSSSDFNPRLKKERDGFATFSLQVAHRPRGIGAKHPEDGLYLMAADISSVKGGKTKVDVWRPALGYTHIAKSFEGWVKGADGSCPKLK